jgi:hypothetical protein
MANPSLRIHERQEPFVLGGYHHEWNPGNHTLFLGGFLQHTLLWDTLRQSTLFLDHGGGGPVVEVAPLYYDQEYRNDLKDYSAELQQLLQHGDHTLVVGGRVQTGELDTANVETSGRVVFGPIFFPINFPITQNIRNQYDRESVYLYEHWQFWPTLTLIGGVSYDRVHFPENFRFAPISNGDETRDQVSPKAGVVFTPFKNTTIRAAYFQGLGGVSLDQSVRLEPSQVAGFNQAFRNLIPESIADDNSAPTFDGWGLALEQKCGRGTFIGVSGEILSSEVDRQIGVVEFLPPPRIGQTREELDFRERTLSVYLNQLVSDEWSFGARYRLSKADLEQRLPDLPAATDAIYRGGLSPQQQTESVLHQLQFTALYNHSSGFFGGASALWNLQSNQGYVTDRPGDNFWQFNVEAGWRLFRRHVEARIGLFNLTDQNYRLNPLNLTPEYPRGRELRVSLQFHY